MRRTFMSVYSKKGKGWRYDFTLNGNRHTEAWFPTKREAIAAEARRREELKKPEVEEQVQPESNQPQTPTDMDFLELVNRRLDHVKAYNSGSHYAEHIYMAKRWVKEWGKLGCSSVTRDMIEKFILKRNKVSAFTANKEIRYLRATFNFGLKRDWVKSNPVDNISFLPVEKKLKYIPSVTDVEKVISVADPDTQDYLYTITDTMGRMSEINRLTWKDVDLEARYVVLYTRKKRGGHLTPRKIPMTQRLYSILSRRFKERDTKKPWVFWHTYSSSKTGNQVDGPYQERKKIMKTLCEKAGVPYFRYHALRHSGASIMEANKVPIGSIQRILGHQNRTTTEIYLHSMDDAERQAISVFELAREKSHTNSHTENEKGLSPLT
jgi:integrase